MRKSKKFDRYMTPGYGGLMLSRVWQNEHNGRYVKVWCESGWLNEGDVYTVFHLQAGYNGLPPDYREQWNTPEELQASMLELGDLRRWVPAVYD